MYIFTDNEAEEEEAGEANETAKDVVLTKKNDVTAKAQACSDMSIQERSLRV